MEKYMSYMKEQLINLLNIDSPTGFTRQVSQYLMDEYRRQGYASRALRLMETQLAAPHITLHVFENNHPARCLYEKCGYDYLNMERAQPGSLYMFKRIR